MVPLARLAELMYDVLDTTLPASSGMSVMGTDDRLVERVAGQVALVQDAAAGQGETVPGEVGAGGDRWPPELTRMEPVTPPPPLTKAVPVAVRARETEIPRRRCCWCPGTPPRRRRRSSPPRRRPRSSLRY